MPSHFFNMKNFYCRSGLMWIIPGRMITNNKAFPFAQVSQHSLSRTTTLRMGRSWVLKTLRPATIPALLSRQKGAILLLLSLKTKTSTSGPFTSFTSENIATLTNTNSKGKSSQHSKHDKSSIHYTDKNNSIKTINSLTSEVNNVHGTKSAGPPTMKKNLLSTKNNQGEVYNVHGIKSASKPTMKMDLLSTKNNRGEQHVTPTISRKPIEEEASSPNNRRKLKRLVISEILLTPRRNSDRSVAVIQPHPRRMGHI